MKAWYDDIDNARLQRIKTYSAFCDYKSQNLMLQTLYEAMQKKIDEYKETNRQIALDYKKLLEEIEKLKCCVNCKYCNLEFLPYWCNKNNIPIHLDEKCDKWEHIPYDFSITSDDNEEFKPSASGMPLFNDLPIF